LHIAERDCNSSQKDGKIWLKRSKPHTFLPIDVGEKMFYNEEARAVLTTSKRDEH
jgi:hypothetical protein